MRRSLFGGLSLVLLGTILLSLLLPISLESQDESEFIQRLIDGMSVEEKVGQMCQKSLNSKWLLAGV